MKHYHKNPRQITDKQFEQLSQTLSDLGDLSGVVHDLNSDEIIGGNQRSRVFDINQCEIEIIEKYDSPDHQGTVAHGFVIWNDKKYAYRQVRWSPDECEQANIVANKAGGNWDFDILANEFELEDLKDWGFSEHDLDLDMWDDGGSGSELEDPGAQVDIAEELREKWGVEGGQLWELGDHRIICGDCTDKDVVERVMDNEFATLAPVDPPYNVGFDYDGYTVNDEKSEKIYKEFSHKWFAICQSVSERQLITPGCNNLGLWLRWFDAYHWAPWTKLNSMTNGRVSRFWCWEPVLFFGIKWGKNRHSDIFDYPIGQQKGVANHPCPKPLEMWIDIIENYTKRGDTIYDCFLGSGTTIIACENLGRKCRAVEISPAYVAVAIQRWVDMTGGEPVLLS